MKKLKKLKKLRSGEVEEWRNEGCSTLTLTRLRICNVIDAYCQTRRTPS